MPDQIVNTTAEKIWHRPMGAALPGVLSELRDTILLASHDPDIPSPNYTSEVPYVEHQALAVREVLRERLQQEVKWGEQNLDLFIFSAISGEEYGEVCEALLKMTFGGKTIADVHKELTHLAATALATLEYLYRAGLYLPADCPQKPVVTSDSPQDSF